MTVFQAIILGLVQGLTEFLPVSSSGHLVLLQRIFNLQGEMLAFDVLLHLATLLAVVICLRRELWEIIKKPFSPTTLKLLIATVPAVAVALLLDEIIEQAFGGQFLGYGFLFTALLLTLADVFSARRRASTFAAQPPPIGYKDAVVMGIFQGIAVIPGISRSGSCMAGATIFGAPREDAARFCFLMSIPIILGSAVVKLPSLSLSQDALPLVCAFVAAFASALLSVKLCMAIVKSKGFWGFAVYLAALGVFVTLNQYVFKLF